MSKKLELKVVLTAIDQMTAPLRGIAKRSRELTKSYKRDMREYRATIKRTESTLKLIAEQNRKMKASGMTLSQKRIEFEKRYRKQLEETKRTLEQREKLMDRQMASIRRRQRALSRGREMLGSGSIKVATATGLAYAGAKFMQPGFNFEEQMSRVQALTGLEKEDPLFKKLREQAKHLGATTWASATEVADAQGFYAMAGYSPEAIMEVIPSTLDLARASGMDIGRTADIASNILSAFGLDPEDTEDVADILVTAFTGSNTSLEMLGQTMKYVAPVSKDLKISLEETAAMAGILGNVGIQDSQAGTAMRKIYSSLASPNSSGIKALDELNIKTKDVAGNLRSVPELFADILLATKEMGSADRMGLLTKIVGLEAATAFSSMIDEKNMADFGKMMEKMKDRHQIAHKIATVMGDNVKGDWKGLLSAIESVQIAVSSLESGGIRRLIRAITAVVKGVSQWIDKNPKIASGLLVAGSVIASLIGIVGALSMAIGAFNLVVLANPIVFIVSAIVTAIGTLIYFRKEIWDFFQTFFSGEKIMRALGDSVDCVIDFLKWIWDNVKKIGDIFVNAWKSITNAIEPVKDLIVNLKDGMIELIEQFKELFSFETPEWLKETSSWVGDKWDGFKGKIKKGWNQLLGSEEDEVVLNQSSKIFANADLTPIAPVTNHDNRTNNVTINVETRSNASAAVIATETVNAIRNSGLIGDLR